MKKTLKGVHKLIVYLTARFIGLFLYKSEYFPKGRFFARWYSAGYEWVLPDFWGRVWLKRNRGIPWPVSPLATVGRNIVFDVHDLDNFQSPGIYFQTWDARIMIGKGTNIAQNTGLITSNHDLYDLKKRGKAGDIVIGKCCWIGMNTVILPGVVLGDHTIVGAGSIVKQSFPEGDCVIAGNPARLVKKLNRMGRDSAGEIGAKEENKNSVQK